MNRRYERLTDTFDVEADTGAQYMAHEYTTFIETRTLDGGDGFLKGLRRYTLSNGNHLNVNDDGSFTNIHTNEILRRV
jgi:hypothetical protein